MRFFLAFLALAVFRIEWSGADDEDFVQPVINVRFNTLPDSVPEKSFLYVKLLDISQRDATSEVIQAVNQEVTNIMLKNRPLILTLRPQKPLRRRDYNYAVTAVLNIGWSPGPDSSEWIRNGDWMAETSNFVQLKTVKDSTIDIDLNLSPYTLKNVGLHMS